MTGATSASSDPLDIHSLPPGQRRTIAEVSTEPERAKEPAASPRKMLDGIDALLGAGVITLATGAGLVYAPAFLLVLGFGMIALAVLLARTRRS